MWAASSLGQSLSLVNRCPLRRELTWGAPHPRKAGKKLPGGISRDPYFLLGWGPLSCCRTQARALQVAPRRRPGHPTFPAFCPTSVPRTLGAPKQSWWGPLNGHVPRASLCVPVGHRGSRARQGTGAASASPAGPCCQRRRSTGRRDPRGSSLEGVPGRQEVCGPSCQGGLPFPHNSLLVCLPAPRPHPPAPGAADVAGGPPPASLQPISAPGAAPVSGQRSQRLLALRVCLELPCPPSVSLDSPALSWLISGFCCCRQRK